MGGYSFGITPGYVSQQMGRAQEEQEKSWTRLSIALQLDYIRINRLPFWGSLPSPRHWEGGGELWHREPGHYWIEIDHGDPAIWESYGWYPANYVAKDGWKMLRETAGVHRKYVPGVINGDSPIRQFWETKLGPFPPGKEHAAGGGIGTKPFPWDPHHGTAAESISSPWIAASRAKEDVLARIRAFAADYKHTSNGLWTYRLDGMSENNCHTFIWKLLAECELADLNLLQESTDPHFFLNSPPPAGLGIGEPWMEDLRRKTQHFKDVLDAVK